MASLRRLLAKHSGVYQSVVLNLAPSSLLAYWPLTETSGTQANDVSGNARHGTYSGVTLAQIPGPGASMGSAGLWDGLNDDVEIFSASLATALNKNLHTISMWGRVTSAAIWSDGANREALTLQAAISNNGMTDVRKPIEVNKITAIAYPPVAGFSAHTLSTTDWFHIAIVINGASALSYVNSSPLTITATRGTWSDALTIAKIGSFAGSRYWKGYLAHVAVWNADLTAQIAVLATAR